jgi:hypothetical protein
MGAQIIRTPHFAAMLLRLVSDTVALRRILSRSPRTSRAPKPTALISAPFRVLLCLLFTGLTCLTAFPAAPLRVPISTNVHAVFLPAEPARDLLGRRDAFIAALSPLDRTSRLRTNGPVNDSDLLAFLRDNARNWPAMETSRVAAVVTDIHRDLAPWNLPFPPEILLIRTTGREEFGMFYTRENAIIFPPSHLSLRLSSFRRVFLHELFHVLSRHNPELRERLYGILGFTRINDVPLPGELHRRLVTNPDGHEREWRIRVTHQGAPLDVIPLLLAQGDSFSPEESRPSDFLRLLAVRQEGTNWIAALAGGQPKLLRIEEVQGWDEQIGANTGYTIHPDEILAENFVLLINRETNLPTPRILSEMERILRDFARSAP